MTSPNNDLPTNRVLSQFVEKTGDLYTLPAVAVEVLQLTESEKVDARALKECIEKDPALTAKLMRVVNSSLFGLSQEVSDLNQALALLGAKPLKLLVLGFSLPKALFNDVEGRVLKSYWQHSLIKAVAAREIAQRCFRRGGDEAFIAGLLQGLGALVLIQNLGEQYAEFLNQVFEQGGDLQQLETEALGFDHALLSARMLQQWNLPDCLVQAVARSMDAEVIMQLPDNQRPLAQSLHLGELLARLLTERRDADLDTLMQLANRYCGLTVEQLQQLIDELEEKLPPLADAFAVVVDTKAFQSILQKGFERLAEVAAVVAGDLIRGECEVQRVLSETEALSAALKTYINNPTARHAGSLKPAGPSKPTGVLTVSRAPTSDVDPGLIGRLRVMLSNCRGQRIEFSLALLEIDNYHELMVTHGLTVVRDTLLAIKDLAGHRMDPTAYIAEATDMRLALALPAWDRHQTLDLCRQLLVDLPDHLVEQEVYGDVRLSAGIASLSTVPRNFPIADLLEAAHRCLFASQSSGGRVVKSIELV